mmetsp:Transcript_39389/g.85720  ORF Transcript_39389/g.85720 Transcript_39389/m.85720 type:complete len:383 (-) Transcript_39389:297-1445(-)|eukprot:CAMPEP_0118947028 /NCGR_PEP_ID=MMETSP1169-20130426/45245_1 /TAXON_ID=36882 /ORGANISM="Pyramimonas obovata, Strain CCMP722" /LENGTH=382 /DNA_ID=CAMNT_0006893151 /DNA_START=248 /DNA_END=1396 /DNA_ORIENTATION=+
MPPGLSSSMVLGPRAWDPDPELNDLCETVASFDWSKVQDDLQMSTQCSPGAAEVWMVELCRFLVLKVLVDDVADVKLAPSTVVQRAWQSLLLYPADYLALCSSLLRNPSIAILDHNPKSRNQDSSWDQRYAATLNKYCEVFRMQPEQAYWESSDLQDYGVGASASPQSVDPRQDLSSLVMDVPSLGTPDALPPIETCGPATGVVVEVDAVMPVGDMHGETASTSSGVPSPNSINVLPGGSGVPSHSRKRSRSNMSSDFNLGEGILIDDKPASAPMQAATGGTTKSKKPMTCKPVPMNSGAAPPGQVHIKMIDENLQGSCFAVEPTTKFEKLKRAFAEQSGRKEKDFMLYFNGWSLKKSQCVSDVAMSDGDCIQVLPRGWPGS